MNKKSRNVLIKNKTNHHFLVNLKEFSGQMKSKVKIKVKIIKLTINTKIAL